MNTEENRILREYERRAASLPKDLYSQFNPGHLFLTQDIERQVITLLKDHGMMSLSEIRVLDVGCDSGSWLNWFIHSGVVARRAAGIELIWRKLVRAKKSCPNEVHLQHGSGSQLAFKTGTFDLILQFTVLTSVLDKEERRKIASEMLRVLKPHGAIVWYDFYINPYNRAATPIGKAEIDELFPHCQIDLRKITLAPPIARSLAPYAWTLCHILNDIPFLRSHYLGWIEKKID
jgi:SAM-dependent methyltransferase